MSFVLSLEALGFSLGLNSIYVKAAIPNYDDVEDFTKACTVLHHIVPALMFSLFLYTLVRDLNYLFPKPGVNYISALPVHYAPILYERWYGREALVELYKSHRAGDTLYFVTAAALLVTLTAGMMTVLAVTKVVTLEQCYRINNLLILPYAIVTTVLLGSVFGPATAAGFVLIASLAFPFHWIFPVRNLNENQRELGMFVAEYGDNTIGLGVKGTKKAL